MEFSVTLLEVARQPHKYCSALISVKQSPLGSTWRSKQPSKVLSPIPVISTKEGLLRDRDRPHDNHRKLTTHTTGPGLAGTLQFGPTQLALHPWYQMWLPWGGRAKYNMSRGCKPCIFLRWRQLFLNGCLLQTQWQFCLGSSEAFLTPVKWREVRIVLLRKKDVGSRKHTSMAPHWGSVGLHISSIDGI